MDKIQFFSLKSGLFAFSLLVFLGCDRQTFTLARVQNKVTTYTLSHEQPEPVVYTFKPNRNVPGKSM